MANLDPIYILTPQIWLCGAAITTADTSSVAPSTNGVALGTAGASGSYVFRLFVKPVGTNIASVLRVFINNASTVATAANNAMIKEISLPATTANAAAALIDLEIPLNLKLKAGYKLYVSIGTTVSAGWVVTAEAGDY